MVNSLPEQTMKFSEQVENIVRILKHGKREQALFLLGFLCLAIANFFPGFLTNLIPVLKSEGFQSIQVGLNLLSIVPFLWGIIRVWKKAIPGKVEITETVKPSAIKGPFAFGEMDGKIFGQLGREADLSKLLSWVLDSQICFTALKGESGAGKTSLLRAGLVYTLEQDQEKYGIKPIYWEARAENPADDLLRAIHLACPEEKENLKTLDDLIETDCGSRKVIMIDQAEQLSCEKHPEIFDLFRKAIDRKPPHNTTWLIAFRDEYASTWFDFEATIPDFHPPKHSLKIFSEEQAQENMTVLARESGLTPDTAVLREMVNAMSDKGRVSPVEIGIGMMVLSELYAGPVHDISLGSFRESGGVTGLLRTYIKDKFAEGISTHEHSPMQNALLALIDPENLQQRLASGKTVPELATTANLPFNRVRHHLAYLAAQTVRILEQLPGGAFRLAHERLIPALESLAQEMLAAADQARRLLQERYQTWSRAKQAKFLLSGKELWQVLKYHRHFQGKISPELLHYLQNSKNRRNRFIAGGMLVLILLMLTPTLNNRIVKPWQRSRRLKQFQEQIVWLSPGTFEMGDSLDTDEMPVHTVKLDSFGISPYEVTNQLYCDFLNSCDSVTLKKARESLFIGNQIKYDYSRFFVAKGSERFPVVLVNWFGAAAFAKWYTEKYNLTVRLPTEAEWEYACRAGTTTPFNTGRNLTTDQANINFKIGNTTPVGSYPPNAWGLYDMHGNVWEWCQDRYDKNYYEACKDTGVVENPTGPKTGSNRVLRGGSWGDDAQDCRSAARNGDYPAYRFNNVGFRLVFVP